MTMSEKEKKMTKAADAPKPGEAVAVKILQDLDRVHQRIPKF
jgi:hypothetical protein